MPETTGGDRNVIAWLTPPEPNASFRALMEESSDGSWSVVGMGSEKFAGLAATTRAVIIPVVDDAGFALRAQTVIDTAATYGVQPVFMLRTESREAAPPSLPEVALFNNTIAQLRRTRGPFPQFMENRWTSAVDLVQKLNVEAPANVRLKFDGEQPEDPECRALFQRSYHECETLYLRRLGVGRSSAETWRVAMSAKDATQRFTESIAKIELSDNSQEESGFLLVADTIPSRLYAPMVDERARAGLRRSLVVYRFIARSQPFLERLADGGAGLVESLFNHTFERFHLPVATEYAKLGQVLQSLGCLRDSEESDQVGEAAARSGAPGWAIFREQILKLPPVEIILSRIHGDLHAGNLFVHVDTKDVAVIDYATVSGSAPRVWDTACLEVSLAFPPKFILPDGWPDLDVGETLRAAYAYPLNAASVDKADGLTRSVATAIKAVRSCVRGRKEDRAAYAIAVAIALLRFASFDDNGDRARRILAYRIASELVQQADADLRERYASRP
jgi:hypothetical protein